MRFTGARGAGVELRDTGESTGKGNAGATCTEESPGLIHIIRSRTGRHYSRPSRFPRGAGQRGSLMAAQIETTCPNCGKVLKVPDAAIGKVIRCKACEGMFEVADPAAKPKPKPAVAKPAVARPTAAKPATAKPAVAKPAITKPAAPKVEEPKAADAPLGFAKDDDDDDDNPNPFGVVIEGEEARCPHCAKELDPPDTLVCMNCGYDLVERKRHVSKKVYEHTQGDYFKHWMPAGIWGFVILMMTTVFVICCLKMSGWFEGILFEKDEKNPTTMKSEYYLPPGACLMCCFIIWAPIVANGVRVIIKKVKSPKPVEIEKKDE